MASFMTRHFKWYGTICKSSGLMISRSSETSESDRRICFWNKLYLIYSVGCLFVCAIVEIGFFYQLCLAVFAHDVPFTTTVHVLLYVTVNAKVALNATLATVKVRSMHRFLSESSKYEESVQFVAPRNHRRMTPTCCLIRFLLLSAFVANVCTSSYLSLEFVDRLGRGPALGAMLKLTCMAGNFLYFVFDAASFLVLRPCCEVIRLYIEHQHGVLRSIVRRKVCDVIGSERRARLVEDVRFNLCTISDIKRRLNDIWQYAIVTSGGVLLFSFCIGVYLIFVEELWTLENVLAFLNTVSATLDFLDIVILSDAMVTEVRAIRHTLEKAAIFAEHRDYVDQLLYLRKSLKPGEMALSAAGFFSLKSPMLVSLAGAVVTYTVILVQTSDGMKGARPNL
ncbi:hypothetical protein MRX96_054179 [Rhipicephalus microplus]